MSASPSAEMPSTPTTAKPSSLTYQPHKSMPVVGGISFDTSLKYHSVTRPCTRSILPEELQAYIANPKTLVGNKFMPKDGEEIWEVLEVTFTVKGWSSVVQFEGHQEKHQMLFADFMNMLRQGVLNVVELE
ncbi:hypothetical protein D9613_008674 [Agrocybe pediades]|uniref:Uncharacterized protein n=1 Tax=Agrocybe pediades TaxID=84607 RepID=A0A8H4QSG1_9AGAR|nr:hypothetical protein D9613_008674 [Agrocybe pediades]KAF9566514.1 hypothetical protein CPC08DRAFT_758850 [Agrocybe pediades]